MHFLLSLYGVYLLRRHQTELDVKHSLIAGAVIVGVVIIMMVLNAILGTSFFGLAFDGSHNIYGVRVSEIAGVSITLYFTGLLVVLTAGIFYQKLLLSCYAEAR